MAAYARALTDEEHAKLARLARSQTAPVRLARRAEIVLRSARREPVPAIARRLGLADKTVRLWVGRFNGAGLEGLDDAPRSGRPRTYTEEHRGRVIAKARALPPKPGVGEPPPTCHWTLDRLTAELNREGVAIRRSQVRRFLKAERIAWQRPRTWLESDDPAFAEKRGPSSGSTPSRRPAAPSCA
jgi:transposase